MADSLVQLDQHLVREISPAGIFAQLDGGIITAAFLYVKTKFMEGWSQDFQWCLPVVVRPIDLFYLVGMLPVHWRVRVVVAVVCFEVLEGLDSGSIWTWLAARRCNSFPV